MSGKIGKMSLLEIVQNILGALGSDAVNSIGDTIEAYDIAVEVQTTFYELFGGIEDRRNVFQLDALSDVAKPNYMIIPDQVKQVEELFFDTQDGGKITWTPMCYLEPDDFVRLSMSRANDANVITVTDFSKVPLYILTDVDPKYYTSFDDTHLIFDSFDIAKMSSLTEIRTLGFGPVVKHFHLEDTFIPDLPVDQFPLLLSEAKQASFINLKQVSNAKEDQRARRQRVRHQNNRKQAVKRKENRLDFGRKSKI